MLRIITRTSRRQQTTEFITRRVPARRISSTLAVSSSQIITDERLNWPSVQHEATNMFYERHPLRSTVLDKRRRRRRRSWAQQHRLSAAEAAAVLSSTKEDTALVLWDTLLSTQRLAPFAANVAAASKLEEFIPKEEEEEDLKVIKEEVDTTSGEFPRLFEEGLETETMRGSSAAEESVAAQERRTPEISHFEEALGPSESMREPPVAEEALGPPEPIRKPSVVAEQEEREQHVKASHQQAVEQGQLRLRALDYWLRQDHPGKAMFVFYEIRNSSSKGVADEPIPLPLVKGLFNLVCKKYAMDAYQVLRYYRQHYKEEESDNQRLTRMYWRVCDAFCHVDVTRHSDEVLDWLVRSLVNDMQSLGEAVLFRCIPRLVSSLAGQKSVHIGRTFTRALYDSMVAAEWSAAINPGYWQHLLSQSRYYRQDDLPYAEILQRCIARDRRPPVQLVMNVLDNYFPFTDVASTASMLRSIVQLQLWSQESEESEDRRQKYVVDVAALEMMGAAAARTGNMDLNFAVWDVLDVFGLEPTAGIFENTVLAFSLNPVTYGDAFVVMNEMQAAGFEPSLALIRGFSKQLRMSSTYLDIALAQLKEQRLQGQPVSVAALNTIMSGSAERGDVDRVVALLEEYERNALAPDSCTLSFAFEALGKHLRRRTRNPATEQVIQSCLVTAESFLDTMEELGIAPTHYIIRNYVELLCQADQVETATDVVVDAVREDQELVNSKIIYRVALANANMGRFGEARDLADIWHEPIPYLLENIERAKKDIQNYEQTVKEKPEKGSH